MKNNLSMILGARLLTISEVSKATGISRSTLTHIYYKRTSSIKTDTILKICDFLQISMSELFEYDPNEKLNEVK